ncbi:MAG: (2Fe-2S) ferredoxin domain-containing protein [Calothrix sp. C42_A2020_038]|nr:(2Fe-2S) ferredoxin domain-containing protein [Calothrix sp. C42_A2020_038]
MSKLHIEQLLEFYLEGRFVELVIKDGYKLKGLILETSEGERYVKLAKHLRCTFDWRLPPGTWLQIVGTKKVCSKTGEYKLKAERVMAARAVADEYTTLQPAEPVPTKAAKQATILMCQKSDCMNRGGKALCHAMQQELQARDLNTQVTIKPTGCMKNCKGGPNLIMPDKTRYSRIQAKDVPALFDRHLPTNQHQNLDQESDATIAVTSSRAFA